MSKKNDSDVGEHALSEVRVLLQKAQSLPIEQVELIADHFRVDEMLAKATPHRRRVYVAVAEYFEHAAKTRRKNEHASGRNDIGDAVRALIDNFDED